MSAYLCLEIDVRIVNQQYTCEPYAIFCQLVDIGRFDLGAIASNVRVPQVISKDDEEVGSVLSHLCLSTRRVSFLSRIIQGVSDLESLFFPVRS